ncbi:YciI family protein [Planktotalea sp.]|uniref:YciI family protein n=1 Tax=Planktotalea sp. TaxID=2029877 RepID=UPI0032987205
MQFMCLIYSDPTKAPTPGSPEHGAMMQGYGEFGQFVQETGRFVAGDALQGAETATTVSVRDGKTETMDGPFMETKEVLGGYYLLECADLDDAIKCAAKIPTASTGRIEVRPVMIFD